MEPQDPLLRAALTILSEEGPEGLTARRLTARVGLSTKVVYSRFGGMGGVWQAVYAHAFGELNRGLAAGEGLRGVVDAYRSFARDHPVLFDLLYGPDILRHLPGRRDREIAAPGLATLAGHLKDMERAREVWTRMHGIVALERSDWLDAEEAESRLAALVREFES